MDEKIIFEWELPKDYPNFTGHDDLPEAYRVVEHDKAVGGIVVYARWKGEWEANPWSMRPLIRHLLKNTEQAGAVERQKDAAQLA